MSEIFNLFTTLDYKENSISSKTLVEKGGGSITLYAFDKAQGLGKHSSPSVTIIQLVEGKAEITIDGQTTLVRDGDILSVQVDVPFSLHAIHKVKALISRINAAAKKSE